ncbi:hypothetical protein L873DRAFT_1675170, partial [Choiromyces venosus 120613-1]
WCQERLGCNYDDWVRTVWYNELYFSIAGFGSHPIVIRNAAEEYYPDCLDKRSKSGSTMVITSSAFCGYMKSDIVFMEGKVMVNSEVYILQILDPYLIPFWHKIYKGYGWTQVVEDSASRHQKCAIK